MPFFHLCRYPRCGAFISHRGYCDQHKHLEKDPAKGIANATPTKDHSHLYNTTTWRKLRLKILERDNYCCIKCGRSEDRMAVDHIQPHNGNEELFYNESNLQTLCPQCHAKKCYDESMEKIKAKQLAEMGFAVPRKRR